MSRDPTLEDQLCFSLYATSMAINRIYKPLLDELGITYPQYLVLSTLWEADGRTVGAIAERLSLESSTITRVLVSLTDRGRTMKQDSRCLGETLFARAGMEPSELIALNREVLRLRAALTKAETA